MRTEASIVVDRPLSTVWQFYAVDHVTNHPRWDPDVQLEMISDGPLGLGSVIRRRTTRYDSPTEGTMEVVEFEPERLMGVRIQDGEVTTNGWAAFEPAGEGRTRLTMANPRGPVDNIGR